MHAAGHSIHQFVAEVTRECRIGREREILDKIQVLFDMEKIQDPVVRRLMLQRTSQQIRYVTLLEEVFKKNKSNTLEKDHLQNMEETRREIILLSDLMIRRHRNPKGNPYH